MFDPTKKLQKGATVEDALARLRGLDLPVTAKTARTVFTEFRAAIAGEVGEGLMHAIGEDIAEFAAQEGIPVETKVYLLEVAVDLMQAAVVPTDA